MKINKIKLSILAITSLAFIGCGSSGGVHHADLRNDSNVAYLTSGIQKDSNGNEIKPNITNDSSIIQKNIITSNDTSGDITLTESKLVGISVSKNSKFISSKSIHAQKEDSKAALVTEGSSFENNAPINLDGDRSYGIETYGMNSNATNNSDINIHKNNSIGMVAHTHGIVTNSKQIIVDGDHSIGMYAYDNGTIINNPNATITITGNDSIGMYAKGQGSIIDNQGTIILTGARVDGNVDSKRNIGLKISDGATIKNKGHVIFGK